jgi:hypothetical protein
MDFKLINGDISILVINKDVKNQFYDLNIEEYKESLSKLIDRAVKTKLGELGIITNRDGVELLDYGYGNAVYFELAEPLTLSWLTRAKQHILNALSFLPKTVDITSVEVLPQAIDTVIIEIYAQYNNQEIRNLVTLYL